MPRRTQEQVVHNQTAHAMPRRTQASRCTSKQSMQCLRTQASGYTCKQPMQCQGAHAGKYVCTGKQHMQRLYTHRQVGAEANSVQCSGQVRRTGSSAGLICFARERMPGLAPQRDARPPQASLTILTPTRFLPNLDHATPKRNFCQTSFAASLCSSRSLCSSPGSSLAERAGLLPSQGLAPL